MAFLNTQKHQKVQNNDSVCFTSDWMLSLQLACWQYPFLYLSLVHLTFRKQQRLPLALRMSASVAGPRALHAPADMSPFLGMVHLSSSEPSQPQVTHGHPFFSRGFTFFQTVKLPERRRDSIYSGVLTGRAVFAKASIQKAPNITKHHLEVPCWEITKHL